LPMFPTPMKPTETAIVIPPALQDGRMIADSLHMRSVTTGEDWAAGAPLLLRRPAVTGPV